MTNYQKLYLNFRLNGKMTGHKERSLDEVLYTGESKTRNSEIFRHFYRTGEYQVIHFKHMKTITKQKVYLKNLQLFQEYMPPEFDYMYYEFEKIVQFRTEFPELILVMPFKDEDQNNKTISFWIPGKGKTNINLTQIYGANFDIPMNFKRLYLSNTSNKYYSKINNK